VTSAEDSKSPGPGAGSSAPLCDDPPARGRQGAGAADG